MKSEVDVLRAEVKRLQDINEGWRQGNETWLKNELAVALRNVEALKIECARISATALELDREKDRRINKLQSQLEAYQRLDNYGSTRKVRAATETNTQPAQS